MGQNIVKIYTDGGCHGNPGPGAWAALLLYGKHEKEISGYVPETTNNRMEITAALEALKQLKRPLPVHLYTDSIYLKEGITQWLPNWEKRGWKTANKKEVKNKDLWQSLLAVTTPLDIQWFWVKGHSGHPENERVDQLVQQCILAHTEPK